MKQRHFSMLRDFHLADWLTLANAFCGVSAVFLAMLYATSQDIRLLLRPEASAQEPTA